MKSLLPTILCALVATGAALAQPPAGEPPQRFRGVLEVAAGDRLTVRTERDGAIPVVLTPETGINGLVEQSLEDIVDGVFIGTTAARNAEGLWVATEVHIFPEEMRGAGEGHYAWDFPETTMTNATVAGAAAARNGHVLQLQFAGGEERVVVPPDVPIVRFTLGDRSLLVPGIAVFVLGVPQPDRTVSAFAIVAETNGVKPPM